MVHIDRKQPNHKTPSQNPVYTNSYNPGTHTNSYPPNNPPITTPTPPSSSPPPITTCQPPRLPIILSSLLSVGGLLGRCISFSPSLFTVTKLSSSFPDNIAGICAFAAPSSVSASCPTEVAEALTAGRGFRPAVGGMLWSVGP